MATTPVGRSVAGPAGSGSSSGSSGSRPRVPTLDDFLQPALRAPSGAWQTAGRPRRQDDSHRRDTLFQPTADTPSTPAAGRPAAPGPASPDVFPPDAALVARVLEVEAQNRQQAAELQQQQAQNRQQAEALQRQEAELYLLRTPGSAAGDDVAQLAAKVEDQHRLIQQLMQQRLPPAPPAAVPPPAVALKNESKKTGQELRRDPHFQQMSLGGASSAHDVARVVLKMFAPFGAAGTALQQLLLWVLQLPASDASQVPAVLTAVVRAFCADQLKFPLDAGGGVSDGEGSDCFGIGDGAARRRGVFRRLLAYLQDPGPVKDLDAELLISFKERLQPSLRLSDATLALPTFAALLAEVLCFLEHGPSSVLASVVGAFFSYVPCSDRGTANQLLRGLKEDLVDRFELKRQLDLTPFLLPVALTTSVISTAPGSAGVLVSSVVSELLGRAADPATTAEELLRVVDRASQTSGHNGTVVADWVPPAPSTYSQLLTQRPKAAASLGSSASPAAASMSASPVKPASSKSAPAKSAPRQPHAAAKSQPPPVQPGRQFCPHGAACPTAGDLYDYCPLRHTDEDWRAIRAARQQAGKQFFTPNSRRAILQQVAAHGGTPGGGGGGGQPHASPLVPAAGAVALAPQPLPPPPAQPSPSAASAASPSPMGMEALMQFLAAAAPHPPVHPSGVSLSLPVALAAASAPAAVSSVASWGSPVEGVHPMVLADSGTVDDFAPNVRGAPTIPVPAAVSVTSDGRHSVTSSVFDASFVTRTAAGGYVEVHVQPREQPRLSVPLPGGGARPVMLLSPTTVAGGGGVWHVEGRFESGRAPAVLSGYVRLPYFTDDQDLAVDPLPRLTDKIPVDFRDKVMALPVCSLPAGAPVTRVRLGARRPLPSASSLDALPAQAFGGLLRLCQEWRSAAAADVPAYAAMSSSAQSAFRAAHGGHDAAAFMAAGLSHFCVALTELASAAVRPAVSPASSSSPSLSSQ